MLKGNIDIDAIHNEKFELYVVERPGTSVTKEIVLLIGQRGVGSSTAGANNC
jgi:hypothetical protein